MASFTFWNDDLQLVTPSGHDLPDLSHTPRMIDASTSLRKLLALSPGTVRHLALAAIYSTVIKTIVVALQSLLLPFLELMPHPSILRKKKSLAELPTSASGLSGPGPARMPPPPSTVRHPYRHPAHPWLPSSSLTRPPDTIADQAPLNQPHRLFHLLEHTSQAPSSTSTRPSPSYQQALLQDLYSCVQVYSLALL
ncbi:hypothetical protein CROQUDRAFT_85896 [Cronartium quercuum f. sp. fusiforme G11]|uniref:Uncharacterized protein n=1 Tax=Cronartium quercuum f. sp. fusiforme G11 TaxID=708437 RepID=A0A9P6NZD0_9BASI|nr:hypothetical protein CROQUDRAFT_85896 [Cronartium quercuum f. sp. fusiforme G11]